MICTAAGVQDGPASAKGAVRLISGTNDLVADLAIPGGAGRGGLMHALQTVVLAARAAGVPAFDGVYNRLDDEEELAAECRAGRSFGYDGNSRIHPSPHQTANPIFGPRPSPAECRAGDKGGSPMRTRWA